MTVGITGLVTPAEWTMKQTFETIKAAGYDAFELALRDSGAFSLESSEEDLRRIAEEAQAAGIELVSVCPQVKNRRKDLMNADASVRNESIETLTDCIRVTSALGLDTMLVVLGSLTPELYYDVAYSNALEGMKRLAPIAEHAGVKLAIEYVWNKFLLSPIEFARFCDEVGSPNVGFYFDPGNMAIFGYPEHWVRICGRHLMAAHMKDFKRTGSEWTPLGEGDVDFRAVMAELRSLGFDGPLVSEVDPKIASYEDTAAAIRTIMAE